MTKTNTGASQQRRSLLVLRGNDLYETPPIAVEALLRVEPISASIWEPACGRGAIVRVLRAAGYHVVATDLVPWGSGIAGVDFLLERRALAPVIITNPPYKLANQFVQHAIDLRPDKIAMLLRLVWLAGQRRHDLLTRLARVWVFSARLPMMRRDRFAGPRTGSSLDFAWFVWDRQHQGPPLIGWL